MKLGVLTVPLYDRSAEEAFRYLSSLGVQTVEIGTGGSPGSKHSNPEELLSSESKLSAYKDMLKKYNLEISALSCHSNHVHPSAEIRAQAAADFTRTLRLAEKLGVDTVVSFSGCPGDYEGAKYPNWVTCSWPTDYQHVLDYQWNEVLIPFWQGAVAEAANYGVKKIALELHPGFCVYNTATLLRLRRGAIYHFHAKDTKVDTAQTQINGVLDTGNYGDLSQRSWSFRTVGWGHDGDEWKEIISALRLTGYDGAISIEHEDAFMSVEEGLEKAIDFLKDIVIHDRPAQAWWN